MIGRAVLADDPAPARDNHAGSPRSQPSRRSIIAILVDAKVWQWPEFRRMCKVTSGDER
jgi:hypothetical protein